MAAGVRLLPCPEGLAFFIPSFRLGRGENNREHWRVSAKRVKDERGRVIWAWTELRLRSQLALPPAPWAVTLARVSTGDGLDSDNLVASLKAVRDQVAAQLGLPNDRDARADEADRASWASAEDARAPEWGVRVEIRTRAPKGPTPRLVATVRAV